MFTVPATDAYVVSLLWLSRFMMDGFFATFFAGIIAGVVIAIGSEHSRKGAMVADNFSGILITLEVSLVEIDRLCY